MASEYQIIDGWLTDDLGVRWHIVKGKVVCEGDDSEGGGYWCNGWDEAVKILREGGYIE